MNRRNFLKRVAILPLALTGLASMRTKKPTLYEETYQFPKGSELHLFPCKGFRNFGEYQNGGFHIGTSTWEYTPRGRTINRRKRCYSCDEPHDAAWNEVDEHEATLVRNGILMIHDEVRK